MRKAMYDHCCDQEILNPVEFFAENVLMCDRKTVYARFRDGNWSWQCDILPVLNKTNHAGLRTFLFEAIKKNVA